MLLPKTYEPSVCISSDGNVIYFSSERTGGFGGLDIYKSEKTSDGKWSEPVNLGETVNTNFDEDAPFISPDGKTLYFSSKGHHNMGDYDIFISEFNGESWSKPLNLGFPVNSSSDDIFFIVSNQTGMGFFSSNRTGGSGLMDIYKAKYPANTASKAEITGNIFAGDSTPAFVNMSFIESEKPNDSIVIFNDSLTGNFSFPLKFGKTYYININEKNYEPRSDTITVPELMYFCQQFKEIKNIYLNKIKQDTVPSVDSLALLATADSIARADSLAKAEAELKSNLEKARNLIDPKNVVLFRVQIGAFAKPPLRDVFKNIANLQVIPFEDGLTRYFSGAFSSYGEAKKRKEEIIAEGFEGAFIVAFKNSQRISIGEALKNK